MELQANKAARESTSIDKSSWGEGAWQSEPDRIEWTTAAGLPALMNRVAAHGAWCGYVAVPPGHPAHGAGYGDDVVGSVEVHGGLTYAEKCQGEGCHILKKGEPDDVFWFGFDMAHLGDRTPAQSMESWRGGMGSQSFGTYRDAAYVKAECESLAAQLVKLGGV